MRVLGFGTYDTAAHPRVAVLLDGLRAHGHEVEECNIPLGLSTQGRVALLQQPWRLPGLAVRIAARWARLIRLSRRLAPPDVVVVGYLAQFDVLLARRLFPRTPVVLDLLISGAETALDRQVSGGLTARVLERLDRLAIGSADLVVVDTEEHRQLVPAARRADTVVVAVGAEEAWFQAGERAARDRQSVGDDHRLRVVFFGLYTPLQGAPVIGTALGLMAEEPIDITMIGHGQDLAATSAAAAGNPNVTWQSWVAPDELPAVVAAHDVCLGIFGTGAKAQLVVPTKVFQGLAAGAVVVTSDTPPQRRTVGGVAVLVPPGDARALAAALSDLARDPQRVGALRAASAAAGRTAAAPLAVTGDLSQALARAAHPHS